MNKYFIRLKIVFGKNTCDNPNNYNLIKTFEFNCCTFSFIIATNQIKIHQNQHFYSFDLDEIDELFIKSI